MRRSYVLSICLLFSLSAFSCSSPPATPLVEYKVANVPVHKQTNNTYCQVASLYMVSAYYANKIGWCNTSFISSTESATQDAINAYLEANGGKLWTPNSQTGAPQSYSKFLWWHLNTTLTAAATLVTHNAGLSALDFQREHFEKGGGPLIVCSRPSGEGYSAGKGHVFVMTGVQVNKNNPPGGRYERVQQVYYIDPYNGISYTETNMDRWRMKTSVTSGFGPGSFNVCGLAMKFSL